MPMKVLSLLENTSIRTDIECRHGLSLYIEAGRHKILFDVGPDDAFLKNAQKLGVDIADVDTLVLSHGHYDHGGGLSTFLEVNSKAPVYIRESALLPYWSLNDRYIGINAALAHTGRFIFTDDDTVIDDTLRVVSGFKDRICFPSSNSSLFAERNGKRVLDDFVHEQALIVSDGNTHTLFSGCAHNGIINILNRAEEICGHHIDAVVAGFHMYAPSSDTTEDPSVVDEIARRLLEHGGRFYTCHCTGIPAYERMKVILGDALSYFAGGCEF